MCVGLFNSDLSDRVVESRYQQRLAWRAERAQALSALSAAAAMLNIAAALGEGKAAVVPGFGLPWRPGVSRLLFVPCTGSAHEKTPIYPEGWIIK